MKPTTLKRVKSIKGLRLYTRIRVSCVYFLFKASKLIYVGSTSNLESRLAEHRYQGNHDTCYFIPCSLDEAKILEREYIWKFQPPRNTTYNPSKRTCENPFMHKRAARVLFNKARR